ncbi:Dyp-type peroxidase [Amycolatopsis alkalitolerans]|uniref:Dyp-type peroxidase n=1 Tax=Amycolatopsis alkalitolerans TaxID=2547244 RepID=A0A5C4LZG0_9PSEU|nr:Dyp-type peroxidase [Amycolatopsis alkalitolerans]TNC24547.1 Dyp-type peroxidase [Amycolatopsis alkalitolerans]
MAVDLSTPLSWKSATGDAATMLDELQPNIVKAHVRDHLSVLFLGFGDAGEAKAFLRALAGLMKSAKQHLEEVEAFKAGQGGGRPYVGAGLSSAGYAKLGITAVPGDPSFQGGAKNAVENLTDPPVGSWEQPYQQAIDAVVLIGDANAAAAEATRAEVLGLLPPSVTVLGEETGTGRVNANGDGIEHFGYVDGRSQPLFLTEEIETERDTTDGINEWNPSASLSQILVPDPAAPDPGVHFGSYLVFRKLEQNVRLFKQAEQHLAEQLALTGEDAERAGAMLIGRFEDGTPLVVQSAAGAHSPVENDFSYDSDKLAQKCPFQAHIRKTNPRGSGGAEPPEAERAHLMARRGQTYGQRTDDPNGDVPPEYRPENGVGLLFMAFNSSLGNQFEFTQRLWANNAGFPVTPDGSRPGLDPVIGQGERPGSNYSRDWGHNDFQAVDPIPQAVTLLGGEYFFAPSLAFLRGL